MSLEFLEIVKRIYFSSIEILNAIDNIIIEIHNGNERYAIQKLNDLFLKLEEIIKYKTIEDINLREDIDSIEKINGKLSELLNAFENQDFVLFADILEFEVMPIIQSWSEENKRLMEEYNI